MVACPDILSPAEEWRVANDITLLNHKCIDFVMGIDQPPTTPFKNPRSTDWAMYKIQLAVRVTTPERRIKSLPGIKKTPQKIKTSMRETFEKDFPLKTP